MSLARWVLGLSGLAFLAIGVPSLIDPSFLLSRAGIGIAGPLADGDLRAVYGALQIGLGALLLRGVWREHHLAGALELQQVTFGALVLGRAVGWLAMGAPGPVGLALHGAEGLGFVAGWIARRRIGATPTSA